MSRNISTGRWQVRPLTVAAGAAFLGGGLCMFEFRNQETRESCSVMFFGGGLGVGVKASAASGSWSTLPCRRSFSFNDLNWAGGRVTTAGAGLGGGYALTFISAWTGQGTLFNSVSLSGFEWGSGAGASAFHGTWKVI